MDLTDAQLKQLAAAVTNRRDSKLDYGVYESTLRQSGHNDFSERPARHHKVIIQATLDLIHNKLPKGKRRLMILAPPGSAKSTYASVRLPTFFSALYPHKNVLSASNTAALAENFNRRRRAVCRTKEWSRISGTEVDPNAQGLENFSFLQGGNVRAAGVGASIVGFRSDFNILDDPVTSFEQANSTTQLSKAWDWYRTEFRTRLKPDCPELLIMQRWSAFDIAGLLLKLEGDSWHVLRLPMECDDPAIDPLGRRLGEPLWDDWYSSQQLADAKTDPYTWAALWQQHPADSSGTWLPLKHVGFEESRPLERKTFMALDLALSISAGDWSVASVFDVPPERKLILSHMYRDRVGPDTLAQKVLEMNETFEPEAILLEDDNASKVFKRLLLEKAKEAKRKPPIYDMPMRGQDKEMKAAAFRGLALNELFYLVQGPWNSAVLKEVNNFPGPGNDDIVDTLGLAGRYYTQVLTPRIKRDFRPGHMRGSVNVGADGQVYTSSTLGEMWAESRPREQW